MLRVVNWLFRLLTLIWAFTESDFLTFVLPNTAFGVFVALSNSSQTSCIIQRIPSIILFNWSNLLVFDIANQWRPESVREDMMNKPWRPIPSGRLTSNNARNSMLLIIPATLLLNSSLGVWKQTALLFILTWIYNDLGGGDSLARNLIIAAAFGLYNEASLYIATQQDPMTKRDQVGWILLVSCIILTTMQVQDLKDQSGDSQRGRRTLPLAIGDGPTRWLTAIFTVLWSLLCPYIWYSPLWGWFFPVSLGAWVAGRAVCLRGAEEDACTWRAWCLWTASIYTLPALEHMS